MSREQHLTELVRQEQALYQEYVDTGVKQERERIIKRIENQICFDALADSDGRCSNHGGKCYELRQLIKSLQGENK